jgi:hypothetical protein
MLRKYGQVGAEDDRQRLPHATKEGRKRHAEEYIGGSRNRHDRAQSLDFPSGRAEGVYQSQRRRE